MNKKVTIIGAGPAGLVAAANLLNSGVEVTILEKTKFPRISVGESLLPISIDHFKQVGLFDALNAADFLVKYTVRFIKGEKQINFVFAEQYTENAQPWTWQVARARFDQTMANAVIDKGAKILFETEVTAFNYDGKQAHVSYKNAEGEHTIDSDFVFDASGFGLVLPRLLGMEINKTFLPNYAVFSHFKDEKRANYFEGERIWFDVLDLDLWAWSIPIENEISSVGIVGHKRHFEDNPEDQEKYMRELINKSEFGKRYNSQEMLFQPIWHKGYSQSVDTITGEGFALIGNSTEFLDPVFSSGVAMATSSAIKATDCLIRSFNGEKVDWKEYEEYIEDGVDVFRTYVKAWYSGDLQDIFFTDNLNEDFKLKICSVLAGYVWDKTNPFVTEHKRAIKALAQVARQYENQ